MRDTLAARALEDGGGLKRIALDKRAECRNAPTLLGILQSIQNGPLVGLDPAVGQRFVGGSYANQQNVRHPDFAVADLNRHHDREHWRAAFAEIGRHEELLEPRGLYHARHEA